VTNLNYSNILRSVKKRYIDSWEKRGVGDEVMQLVDMLLGL
jgi:hypothetical protein